MVQPASKRLVTEATLPELTRDVIGVALVPGPNVTITPSDTGDTITIGSTASSSGGGATPGTAQFALRKFYGAAATRDTAPVVIALEGDSYTDPTYAGLWPARFRQLVQGRFPLTSGAASPANSTTLTTARASLPNGVQIINSAVSGRTSANFTYPDISSKLAALGPALFIVIIGANDVNGVTPAQHKANLLAEITYQKANNPNPFAYVIVHAFPRTDMTITAGWDAYGQAEADLAAADPGTVIFVDVSPDFAAVGYPGSDPYGMVAADHLHPSQTGSTLLADRIWDALAPSTPLMAFASSSSTGGSSGTTPTVTAPGAPTGLTATAGATQVALSWTAPASTGGAPITDYVVQYRTTGSSTWSTFADGTGTATNATVAGLTNGTGYDFRVAAVNSAGPGTASSTATATPVAAASSTAITETWPGADGAAWPSGWAVTTANATVQGGAGRLDPTSYAANALKTDATAFAGDFDEVVTFKMSGQTAQLSAVVGLSASASVGSIKSTAGYTVECAVGTDGTLATLVLYQTGNYLGAAYPALAPGANGFTVRLQRSGSTIRSRAWAAGGTEPSTWAVTATDSAPLATTYKPFLATSDQNGGMTVTDFRNLSVTPGTPA